MSESNGQILTKEQILSAEDLPREDVDVPEWGGHVIVRTLTGRQRDAFEARTVSQSQKGKNIEKALQNCRARLAALVMVDRNGARLFTDAEVSALGDKSGRALDRVYEVGARLAGLSEQDVEELVKNSEATPDDSSGSA